MKFIERYLEELAEHRAAQAESILGGSPQDFPSYKYRVGYIAGLDAARMIFEQLARRIVSEDR